MEHFYRDILDNLYDGMYFVDSERRITFWNKAAERITGFLASEVRGRQCFDSILRHVTEQGEELCMEKCPLAQTLEDGSYREADVYLHHKAGHMVPVSIRIAPVFDAAGAIVGAVELFSDNTSRAQALARLRELEQFALLDPLTQLGNRRFIEMNLQTRLDELCRYGFPFGVLFVDIDRFKLVNDTYGHDCGDAVLRMVANTLAGSSRLSDCFGRWGGEEFIGIICNVDQDGLLAAAERLRLLVKSACLDYAGQTVGVTVSIGAALARPGDAMEDLVRRVDQLMYQGKRQGRDCVSSESSPQPGPLL